MPDLSSILSTTRQTESLLARVTEIPNTVGSARWLREQWMQRQWMLDPLSRQMELLRAVSGTFDDPWHSISGHIGAEEIASRWAMRTMADLIPQGPGDALRASQSIKLMCDLIEPNALNQRSVSGSRLGLSEFARSIDEAQSVIASGLPKTSEPGGYVAELLRSLESVHFPRVPFGDEALRAFLEGADPPSASEGWAPDAGSDERQSDDPEPATVVVRPFPPDLLTSLRTDPAGLQQLTPKQFELLVADRLAGMGFEPILTGHTYRSDGGIDIIAVPRERREFGCVIAVQCEHHRGRGKTGRGKVGDLLRWRGHHFQLGVLVTNTTFTKPARFEAAQPNNRTFLRLRGFSDIVRWIQDNYSAAMEWTEIPDTIELAPGFVVRLPTRGLRSPE